MTQPDPNEQIRVSCAHCKKGAKMEGPRSFIEQMMGLRPQVDVITGGIDCKKCGRPMVIENVNVESV